MALKIMIIPEHIFLRLYIRFGGLCRKFYWFEMKRDELYWGDSSKGASSFLRKLEGSNEFDLSLPKDFNEWKKSSSKNSYHRSGQVHIKERIDDSVKYYSVGNWIGKDSIKQPYRISSVITWHLKHFTETVIRPRVNEKKNEYAVVINISDDLDVSNHRLYFDFFLSPEGKFNIPLPLFGDQKLPYVRTHSLSPDLVLVIAFGPFDALDVWNSITSVEFIGRFDNEL